MKQWFASHSLLVKIIAVILTMGLTATTSVVITTNVLEGAPGEQGAPGADGVNGTDGKSAYELAVDNGYTGTISEWLASLVGEVGAAGQNGTDGKDGVNGNDGKNGANGKSAYELAVEKGYSGTLDQWLESLIGKPGTNGVNGTAGADGKDGSNGKSAYELACDNGFEGTLAQWLDSLVGKDGLNGTNGTDGTDGTAGKSAYELACDNGFEGTLTEWLASLVGAPGENGANGSDGSNGKSAYELAVASGYEGTLQTWLASLVGSNGNNGKSAYEIAVDHGYFGTEIDWLKSLVGEKGNTGNGISSIQKTKSEGLVDTYTITYTNGDTTTFVVTNGVNGAQGIQGIQGEKGEDGHTTVITIQNGRWYIDGVDSGKSAEGIKGDTGNGISSIAKTKTEGLVDTYTITFTNGDTTAFTVTNGAQGIQGIQGEKGADGHSPIITIQNGYWYIDGVKTNELATEGIKGDTGNGISSIAKTKTEGLVDTYTITFTNGDTTTFTVTNGANGTNGADGAQGIQGIQGEKGEDGHTPVITIQNGKWYIDGVDTGKSAEGIKGSTGNGISSIAKTKTEGLVDTYTITFTNGDTSTFTVTNGATGAQGIQGIQGEKGEDGHTTVITIQNGRWYIDGVDSGKSAEGIKGDTGNGISSIAKTKSEGLVDTYTITFTNGDTTTFTVTNGATGAQGIQGIQGEKGEDGHTPVITIQNGKWYIDGVDSGKSAEGIKGDTGNGISSIAKTSTAGLVDIYTITFTNGDTTTFTVTNGADGAQGQQGIQGIQGEKGEDGHTPVITIQDGYWYIDGVNTNESVGEGVKGDTGNGISSIAKTKTEGLIDTYTITFTNGDTTTFTVTNGSTGTQGEPGIQGIQGEKGEDGHTPVITIQNGKWYIDGVDSGKSAEGIKGDTGNGISSIAKTSTAGLVDIYTITFTNGDTTTFTVTNGADGAQGQQGIQGIQGEKGEDGHTSVITIQNGKWYIDGVDSGVFAEGEKGDDGLSAFEIYQKYHPEYTGTEQQWIESLKGADGAQGTQGVSVTNAYIDEDLHLWIVLSDGQKIDAGYVGVSISAPTTTYTVTFVDHDGKTLKTQTVNGGESATAPAEPQRDGYTFAGWDKTFNNVTSDLTVTATYTIVANQVCINYTDNGDGTTTAKFSINGNVNIAMIELQLKFDLTNATYKEYAILVTGSADANYVDGVFYFSLMSANDITTDTNLFSITFTNGTGNVGISFTVVDSSVSDGTYTNVTTATIVGTTYNS